MMEINEKSFALLCYTVLMQDINTKSLDYIEEKAGLTKMGFNAWQKLDMSNQTKVLVWLGRWGYNIPAWVEDYEAEVTKEISQNISENYPLGGSAEPYDIEKEKELCSD